RFAVFFLRLKIDAHKCRGVILLHLVQVDGGPGADLVTPHAEPGVVARAVCIPAGGDVDAVAGDRVGSFEVPAETDWYNGGIGQPSAGVRVDFRALEPVVHADRRQDLVTVETS